MFSGDAQTDRQTGVCLTGCRPSAISPEPMCVRWMKLVGSPIMVRSILLLFFFYTHTHTHTHTHTQCYVSECVLILFVSRLVFILGDFHHLQFQHVSRSLTTLLYLICRIVSEQTEEKRWIDSSQSDIIVLSFKALRRLLT